MGLSVSDHTLHCLYRAQLFDLAVSLLPGLDHKEIDLLFVATEPALKVYKLFLIFGYNLLVIYLVDLLN